MTNKQILAIDVGGTKIKSAQIDENGNMTSISEIDSYASVGAPALVEQIVSLIESTSAKIEGVAIATAGQVNHITGEIIYASNAIQGYQGTQLRHIIKKRCGVHSVIDNDVNCALLGEHWLGAAQNYENVFMITLGTGIGGAILIDKKIYRGTTFSAGEIGYMQVNRQSFQSIASTSALVTNANNLFPELGISNGKFLFELSKHHKGLQILLSDYFDTLALGIANLIFMINPARFIIGGGIANQPSLIDSVKLSLEKYLPSHILGSCEVVPAALGNYAGCIGAAKNFWLYKERFKL